MTKKNKYTIAGIILVVFFLGASITGVKFPIGTSTLHDSTSAILTLNKGMFINGNVRTSGITFKELGGNIEEDINGIVLNSDFFTFQTQYETPVMILDSAGGMNLLSGNFQADNFTKLGGSSAPAIKQKYFTGVIPAVNNTLTIAHGIADYNKIIGIRGVIKDDSSGRTFAIGYNGSTGLTTGTILYTGASNIGYFVPSAAVNLPGDTIKITLTYTQ